ICIFRADGTRHVKREHDCGLLVGMLLLAGLLTDRQDNLAKTSGLARLLVPLGSRRRSNTRFLEDVRIDCLKQLDPSKLRTSVAHELFDVASLRTGLHGLLKGLLSSGLTAILFILLVLDILRQLTSLFDLLVHLLDSIRHLLSEVGIEKPI